MIPLEDYLQLSPYQIEDPGTSELDGDILLKAIKALPESVRSFLTATETAEYIQGAIQHYGLNYEQGESLSRVIRDITIGKLFYGDMAITLQEKLGIPLEQATTLTQAIAQNLFSLIGKELQEIQKAKFNWRIQGNAQPPTPVATNTQQERPNNSTISLRQPTPTLHPVLEPKLEPQEQAIEGNTINLRALKD